MARKKQSKKTNWLKVVLLYIFVPIVIWFLAFVAWLYWDDIVKLFSKNSGKEHSAPSANRTLEKTDKPTAPSKRLQEKILEDDRKKLEDILKQRQ